MTALVSIITPTFEREAYLTQTLRWARVLHAQSTSSCFPQYRLPTFLVPVLFGAHQEFLGSLRQRRGPAETASTLRHLERELGGDFRVEAGPIAGRALTKEAHRGVPSGVRALPHPAPIRFVHQA